MPTEIIRFTRLPVKEIQCTDCNKTLHFGEYVYYQQEDNLAICISCGTKKGWSDKDRASKLVEKLELQEEIKALRERKNIETDALHLIRQQVDLHRFGENFLTVSKQVSTLVNQIQSYLNTGVASAEEKELLKKSWKTLDDTLEVQKEIKEAIEAKIYLIRQYGKKKRKLPKIVDEYENENEITEEELPQLPN